MRKTFGSPRFPTSELLFGSGSTGAHPHWCRGCKARKVVGIFCDDCQPKMMSGKLEKIVRALGLAGHTCGTCGMWLGGCPHSRAVVKLAIAERWPMVTRLRIAL